MPLIDQRSVPNPLTVPGVPTSGEVRTVAVSGAGLMGCGIVAACLRAGLQVRLHDVDPDRLKAAERALDPPMSQLTAVSDLSQLGRVDVVIEAIPEDLAIKREWLTAVEPALPPETLLATNTSSLPLSKLSAGLRHPERMCGLHFCHPVEQRRLVEVVRGPHSGRAAVARAEAFARQIGKSPVIVGDGPGFVLNRLLSLYLTESLELIQEGVALDELDAAAARLGMPLGPLQQLDTFGVELALAVGRHLWSAFPDRWIPSELLIAVCKYRRRSGEMGRGFYAQTEQLPGESEPAGLDPTVLRIVNDRQRSGCLTSSTDMERRLWLPLLVEATRILEDGLVGRLGEIDRILELGLGMRAGGFNLEQRAANAGADRLQSWLRPLESLGKRFVPEAEFQRWIPSAVLTIADGWGKRSA